MPVRSSAHRDSRWRTLGRPAGRPRRGLAADWRLRRKSAVLLPGACCQYFLARIVRRTCIDVDHHRRELRKVLPKAVEHSAHDAAYGGRVVMTGDAHHQFRLAEEFTGVLCSGKESVHIHSATPQAAAGCRPSLAAASSNRSKYSGIAASTRFQFGIGGTPSGSSRNSSAARRRLLANVFTASSSA